MRKLRELFPQVFDNAAQEKVPGDVPFRAEMKSVKPNTTLQLVFRMRDIKKASFIFNREVEIIIQPRSSNAFVSNLFNLSDSVVL